MLTADAYRRFAREEAAGRSPRYEQLALAVAEDAAILAFLEGLPRAKRQPNLLFAAARWQLGEMAVGLGCWRGGWVDGEWGTAAFPSGVPVWHQCRGAYRTRR
jgi:hypothetical protein